MTRQTDLSTWVDGIPRNMHDCRYDVLWERDGCVPPCRLPIGHPHYEPPSVTP